MHAFFQNLLGSFPKKGLCVVLYLLWVVSVIGAVDNLAGRYALSPELARRAIALLALLGGFVILGLSYLPKYRPRYTNLDRAITFVLVLLISYVLIILPVANGAPVAAGRRYIVQVQSAETFQPIRQATVLLELPGMPVLQRMTDDAGHAVFDITRLANNTQVRIVAKATGYNSGEKEITFGDANEASFIVLKPSQ
jgi:hypothetical protein